MAFNLTKYTQMMTQPLPSQPMAADPLGTNPMMEDTQGNLEQTGEYTEEQKQQRINSGDFETFPFVDEGDLTDYMNKAGEEVVQQHLLASARGVDNANSLGSFIQGFYLEEPENRLRYAASNIWPMLDNSVKRVRPENGVDDYMGDQGTMETPVKSTEKVEVVMPTVAESNKEIQKLAQQHSKQVKENKGFNLSKYAQHKTVEELVLHGPDSKRISPFTGQLESDWHVIERNKGWGYRVGDLWNLDFEQFWRENIMDKYSRPYKDKDGNFVGGYLQKRFEVDKWIPEENNIQLKPGQYRKPYIPEQRSTEARLEAMRAKKDRGYKPDSDGDPYDWNKKPEYAETKIAKGFNIKQYKQAQFEESHNPNIHLQEQQEIAANDSLEMGQLNSPISVDEWRQDKVNQLAESQGRLPDEMLKIVLDRGLEFFAQSDSGFGATMAATKERIKKANSNVDLVASRMDMQSMSQFLNAYKSGGPQEAMLHAPGLQDEYEAKQLYAYFTGDEAVLHASSNQKKK
jgi:hypothetical protein